MLCGRAVAHADAHGATSVPGGAAHPARALTLYGVDDGVGRVVVAECDEDLIDRDRREDLRSIVGETLRHSFGEAACAFDEVGQSLPSEVGEDRPDRDRACGLRHLDAEVHRDALGVAVDVGGAHRHRPAERAPVAADDDAAVVRGVEPLVTVGRP